MGDLATFAAWCLRSFLAGAGAAVMAYFLKTEVQYGIGSLAYWLHFTVHSPRT